MRGDASIDAATDALLAEKLGLTLLRISIRATPAGGYTSQVPFVPQPLSVLCNPVLASLRSLRSELGQGVGPQAVRDAGTNVGIHLVRPDR